MNLAFKNNSLYTILFNPSDTFKEIFKKRSRDLSFLFILGCVWQATDQTWNFPSGTFISSSLVLGIIFLICVNWPVLYAFSATVTWLSKFFGGKGTTKDSMTVVIWSFAPGIIAIAIYILAFLIFGEEVIRKSTAFGTLLTIRTILVYLRIAIAIWALFIFVKGMMYVHKISLVNAIIVSSIPFITLYIVIFLLTLI